ncbi:hypothetical protein BGW80DRAFT_1445977 [Lactifluus volemus]|nr:hypothetical protein BGW80DRAFT_1445977 [Lactifluus volemus]
MLGVAAGGRGRSGQQLPPLYLFVLVANSRSHQHYRSREMDITNPREVPRTGQDQSSSNFSDSSGPLYHMYIKMTEEEDEKMAHRWQKDADGILIFTGLFSASLAALLAVSVQDLKPNSQDTSAFYLGNIYQLLADPNVSRASILASATPSQPPTFSPPKSAVLVNSLWFLSLVISLTCALLATMLQQWARRYVTITQPARYSPHKRASIRAFLANGVDKFHLPWSVEALPALLHLSLFLFFSGLVIYLFNINHTVYSVVVWWVVLSGCVYGCITLMPIFWRDSPYYSPLSSSVWLFHRLIFIVVISVRHRSRRWLKYVMSIPNLTKVIQRIGSQSSAEINNRILTWTLHALDEDKELEQFFEAIPGFCSSPVVDNLERVFAKVEGPMASALYGFLDRTLSSSLVLHEDKKRRVMICAKAVDAAHLSYATTETIFWRVFECGADLLRSADIWRSLRSSGDQGLCSQGIVSSVIASVPAQERDSRWMALVEDQLDISEEVLQDYLAHGDTVLLANFIHITRPLFRLCLQDHDFSMRCHHLRNVLQLISKLDIENTLPRVQHDFCALWNEITREAHNRTSHDIAYYILKHMRQLYISLHQGTDAAPTAFDASTNDYDDVFVQPSSYPLCNLSGHHSHNVTGDITDPTNTSSRLHPLDAPALNTITPPSLTADHGRIQSAELSLHDVLDVAPTVEFSHHSPPSVNVETTHSTATSLDQVTQGPTDTVPTILPTSNSESDPHSTLAVLTFAPPSSFTPPSSHTPDPQGNADIRIAPQVPLSGPALSDTLPANPQSSIALRFDHVTASELPPTSAIPLFLTQTEHRIAEQSIMIMDLRL